MWNNFNVFILAIVNCSRKTLFVNKTYSKTPHQSNNILSPTERTRRLNQVFLHIIWWTAWSIGAKQMVKHPKPCSDNRIPVMCCFRIVYWFNHSHLGYGLFVEATEWDSNTLRCVAPIKCIIRRLVGACMKGGLCHASSSTVSNGFPFEVTGSAETKFRLGSKGRWIESLQIGIQIWLPEKKRSPS